MGRDKRRQNEAVFKRLNQRFAEVMTTFLTDTGYSKSTLADFFCECGDKLCVKRITLSLDRYREIADAQGVFVLRPGHQDAVTEKVVEEHPTYYLIER